MAGGPDLGSGPLAVRARRFEQDHAWIRSALLREPRGFDAMVGALVCAPDDPSCETGVIFFNTEGNLGMCGHGAIGLAVTLGHQGRITQGVHRFETPVGPVAVDLQTRNIAAVQNVESYRHAKDVVVDVAGLGTITGDVAWGGNWFFLVNQAPFALDLAHVAALTDAALAVKRALKEAGITGLDAAEIDHVEFFGPAERADGNSRNFVLCPGGAYDRSPCGTGTSAKLACLAADGKLAPGQTWRQESVIGSTYTAQYHPGKNGGVIPTITGEAFVVAEATLHFDQADPFRTGIGPSL